MSAVLTDVKADGRVLYCVALEVFATGATGFLYVHARSRDEVVNHLLKSKSLKRGTRVAWIAPAVGVKYDEPAKGEVKEVFV